jgi:hypothetical protein
MLGYATSAARSLVAERKHDVVMGRYLPEKNQSDDQET